MKQQVSNKHSDDSLFEQVRGVAEVHVKLSSYNLLVGSIHILEEYAYISEYDILSASDHRRI